MLHQFCLDNCFSVNSTSHHQDSVFPQPCLLPYKRIVCNFCLYTLLSILHLLLSTKHIPELQLEQNPITHNLCQDSYTSAAVLSQSSFHFCVRLVHCTSPEDCQHYHRDTECLTVQEVESSDFNHSGGYCYEFSSSFTCAEHAFTYSFLSMIDMHLP